jgi:hypothetical protein
VTVVFAPAAVVVEAVLYALSMKPPMVTSANAPVATRAATATRVLINIVLTDDINPIYFQYLNKLINNQP